MLTIRYSKKGTPFVEGSELYEKLEIKEKYGFWVKSFLNNNCYTPNVDYHISSLKKGEVLITLEMAKTIAVISNSNRARHIREYLISLEKKVEEGKLLDHEQVKVLLQICQVLGYFTVQKRLENEHFLFFNNTQAWWSHRARILGYDTQNLKDIVKALGKKYKNQRQAVFHTDKFKLIRAATIDLFMSLGKSEEYAKNMAVFVEGMAKELRVEIYDDTDCSIDFKKENEKKTIFKLQTQKKLMLESVNL